MLVVDEMAARLSAGNIVMDGDRYAVWVDGEPVELTYLEFELLATLIRHRGRVLSAAELLAAVWGAEEAEGASRKVAVHISRLRKKISGSRPYAIRTVAKRGYSLSSEGR
jgi:two-component system alkaline phosphatase synthesis response regulator PhoP